MVVHAIWALVPVEYGSHAEHALVDDEFKKGWVTSHAVEKLSGNREIEMFE